MPAIRSAAQQAAARTNGARSHGPVTDAGKARSAQNGTRHGLRCGPFALLPGEDRDEFAALHAAVAADWGPRDAYEQHWVMELVTSMWRQDRLRGLELATLTVAESPPSDTTVRKLGTYARYGARIDKDIGRALQALRVLRRRPDAWIEKERGDTHEPERSERLEQNLTNELSPRTYEPARSRQSDVPMPAAARCARPPQRNMAAGNGEALPLAGNQDAHRLRAALHHDTFEPDLNGNRFDRAALLASGIDIPEIAAPGA